MHYEKGVVMATISILTSIFYLTNLNFISIAIEYFRNRYNKPLKVTPIHLIFRITKQGYYY